MKHYAKIQTESGNSREVCKSIDVDNVSLKDLSIALKDIDLDKLPIHINGGFSSLEILALLVAFLKKKYKTIDKIKGSIDTDPLPLGVLDQSKAAFSPRPEPGLWQR